MAALTNIMHSLEIDQVCIVVKDMEKTVRQLSLIMNIGPFEIRETDLPDAIVHGRRTHVRARRAYAMAGAIELEVIEPGQGENIYWEFLHSRGEGVHHFGILVSDIESEIARFEKHGIGVLHSADTPRTRLAYMDTEDLVGVILELRQRK